MSEQKTHSILQSIKDKLSRINGNPEKTNKSNNNPDFEPKVSHISISSQSSNSNLNSPGSSDVTKQAEENPALNQAVAASQTNNLPEKSLNQVSDELPKQQNPIATNENAISTPSQESSPSAGTETSSQEQLLAMKVDSILDANQGQTKGFSSFEDLQNLIGEVPSLLGSDSAKSTTDPLAILAQQEFSILPKQDGEVPRPQEESALPKAVNEVVIEQTTAPTYESGANNANLEETSTSPKNEAHTLPEAVSGVAVEQQPTASTYESGANNANLEEIAVVNDEVSSSQDDLETNAANGEEELAESDEYDEEEEYEEEDNEEDEGPPKPTLQDAERALFGEEFVIQKYGPSAAIENKKEPAKKVLKKKSKKKSIVANSVSDASVSKPNLATDSSKLPENKDLAASNANSNQAAVESSKEINSTKNSQDATKPAPPSIQQQSEQNPLSKPELAADNSPKQISNEGNKQESLVDESSNPDQAAEVCPVMRVLKTEIDAELARELSNIGFDDKKIKDEVEGKAVDLANQSQAKLNNQSKIIDPKSNGDAHLHQQNENHSTKSAISPESSGFSKERLPMQEVEISSLSNKSLPVKSEPVASNLRKSANLINDQTIIRASLSVKKLIDAKNALQKISGDIQDKTLAEIAIQILEPKLEKWLNDNLAEMVERVVKEEIACIMNQNDNSPPNSKTS